MKSWNRFLILFLTQVGITSAHIFPKCERLVSYDQVMNHKLFPGSMIGNYEMKTSSGCAMICGRIPECLSFNFCGRVSCLLSSEDLFSLGKNESFLEDNAECKYWGMKRESFPVCKENGDLKNITNDEDPGICEINGKRVDSPMVLDQIHTDFEWKVFPDENRGVHLTAHGGVLKRPGRPELSWFKIGPFILNWDQAKSFCESIGGNLFTALNGTKEQLDFSFDTFGDTEYWVGIYTENFVNWLYLDGGIVAQSQLVWYNGSPDKSNSEAKKVKLDFSNKHNRRQYLMTEVPGNEYIPLCDLTNNL